MKRLHKRITLTAIFLILFMAILPKGHAQTAPVEGLWQDANKEATINIYKGGDGKFFGKIIWLKEPLLNGKPKLDEHNPDEKLRTQGIMGLVILKGFTRDKDVYEDGTIYDPKSGKTYSCKMTLNGNSLNIRGYVGISLFGRTTVWTRTN